MKQPASAILIAAMLAAGTSAMAETKTEGRVTAELTFASIDRGEKGYINMGDMEQFRADVFAGMDYSGDGKVTYKEFSSWDPGFVYIAEQEGKKDAYTTASKIVFAFWDRNGDGEITTPEMRFSVTADFRRADLDGDGVLTEMEFLMGFPIIVAMRAALRPDL